jgi:hypothetical protein
VTITACDAKSTPRRKPPWEAAKLAGRATPTEALCGEITKHAHNKRDQGESFDRTAEFLYSTAGRSPSQFSKVKTITLAADTSLT